MEGHESVLIPSIPHKQWEKTDAFIEPQSEESRISVFLHLNEIDINLFSQKIGWKKAKGIEDIPINYKEGYIFVTKKDRMTW